MVDEHISYVAMEYVHGGNLSRYTSAERLLPVADVVEIAFKCCGALDYAYRQGVVHRDIKPANILVARGTEVKVADFGAAFLRNVETTQKLRVGSPSYVAPEQIRDDPLTHQSDMYSLGVLLYELLLGRGPFYGASTADILRQGAERGADAPRHACARSCRRSSTQWCCACCRSIRTTAIPTGPSWRSTWRGSAASAYTIRSCGTARSS